MVFTFGLTDPSIQEDSKMVFSVVMVNGNQKTMILMKETIETTKRMEKERTHGVMELLLLENLHQTRQHIR